MKTKWLIIFAAILGCVYTWDSSRKSIAESVIDDVYLKIGKLPDGENRALLDRADKQMGRAYASTLVFNKKKIGCAAKLIGDQHSSLEHYLEEIRTAPDGDTGVAGIKSVAQTFRDLYASGVTKFKIDLEYVRRGF